LRDFSDDFISGRHALTTSRVYEFWLTIERQRSPVRISEKINVCDAMHRGASVTGTTGFATNLAQDRRSRLVGVCPRATGEILAGGWLDVSMIPKSGNWFSEKIMLKQEARARL
jgi:hypothetical protein